MNTEPRPLRILVIEDEPLIRWSIAETLAHEGHIVLEAANARTAVRAMKATPDTIDVVLLDYRLPDSNDLGLLADIRRLMPRSAVVMMTAHAAPEVTRDALDLGAYRVLDKPFDMDRLEALVREADSARPTLH
jgi:DNA-binding NtrC family response regulator